MQYEKFSLIDDVLASYLSRNWDLQDRWLFEQTLYTASTRRSIFQYFPIQPYSVGLDAGTGFGVLPLELAGHLPVTIHGIDLDESKLDVANELLTELKGKNYLQTGSAVQFHKGDLYALPYDDGMFDFVISRFVYQHLHDPEDVSGELHRVLRPGGYACVIDIDDQFSISYPVSEASQRLERAFADLQALRGGDRYVGIKISTYMQNSGFQIAATLIQPQAQHGVMQPGDLSMKFMLSRLHSVQEDIINNGILDERTFEDYIEQLKTQESMSQFNTNALVIVIGRKPE